MPTGIYKRSDKIKNNLRLLRLGKILSSETKNKISIANKGGNKTSFKKGSTAWNKGIKTGIKTKGMTGKYHTEEWKKKCQKECQEKNTHNIKVEDQDVKNVVKNFVIIN